MESFISMHTKKQIGPNPFTNIDDNDELSK